MEEEDPFSVWLCKMTLKGKEKDRGRERERASPVCYCTVVLLNYVLLWVWRRIYCPVRLCKMREERGRLRLRVRDNICVFVSCSAVRLRVYGGGSIVLYGCVPKDLSTVLMSLVSTGNLHWMCSKLSESKVLKWSTGNFTVRHTSFVGGDRNIQWPWFGYQSGV